MALVLESVRESAGFHLDFPTEKAEFHHGLYQAVSRIATGTDGESVTEAKEPKTVELSLLPALEGGLVWTGDDVKTDSEYTYTLTQAEVTEIEKALRNFEGTCDEISQS
jgi:hypothetical protein